MNLHMLSAEQATVARRALEEECGHRHHLVVYLSGAHAYGFPSPDSDVDLKAVHVLPTHSFVGLSRPKLHKDRFEIIDGVEIDYTSNEIGPVLAGILEGNGNYLERILGSLQVITSPEHEELKPLVKATLSRRVFRHYAGFAKNQYRAAFKGEETSAKKVLYVLRTALTGTHLLNTGQLTVDVRQLLGEYELESANELIERKQSGERIALDPLLREHWEKELEQVLEALDQAGATTSLPGEPEGVEALEEWLLNLRKSRW